MNSDIQSPDNSSPPAESDFARIEIDTPFNQSWLENFIQDPQRILRINSLFEFSVFEKKDDNHWHMVGKNLSNEQDFDVTFKVDNNNSKLTLLYNGWLKTSTEISIANGKNDGCRLIITDDYSGTSLQDRQQRISEVDKSILQWGNDIHRYLQQWKRWSWLPSWKPYMLKFWQRMKPSARRISFMLIALTVAEFIIFLFVFVIYINA